MKGRFATAVQVVSLTVGAFAIYRLLMQWAPVLVLPIVILAVVNTLACHALRHHRSTAGRLYAIPGLRHYLDLVARWAHEQSPVEHAERPEDREILLQQPEDFADAADRLRQVVKGHDAAIDSVLEGLRQTLALRRRRNTGVSSQPPISALLLVGPNGIGKRYFGRALAQAVYRRGEAFCVDAAELGSAPAESLFGSRAESGALLAAVRRNPYQVVIVENADRFDASMTRWFADLLATGEVTDPHKGRQLSFQHCVLIFTTSHCVEPMIRLRDEGLTPKAWQRRSVELLTAESPLEEPVLHALTDFLVFTAPDDLTKAEVIALLMGRESAQYNVALSWIDPQILAAEVGLIGEQHGFSLTPARIKKLLHAPLVQAAEQGRDEISLRRRPKKQQPNP